MTTVRVNDEVELCVEAIGDRGAPAILLIGGASSSMHFWDDELCRRLAARGRLVVRYDHRDTGRSTTYPPGAPPYTGADLATDAIAVLDALGIEHAHVVGLSMGGGLAQELAFRHRDRLATLTLMSTTSIAPGGEDLPGMTAELKAAFADPSPEPDWEDRDAVVDHLVAAERPYSAAFDEARARSFYERVFDRSNDIAAMSNHWQLGDDEPARRPLSDLAGLPTLVVHGDADPMFPPAHGRALADAIPGAQLLVLEGVGHELPPPRTWDRLVDALVAHTAVRA